MSCRPARIISIPRATAKSLSRNVSRLQTRWIGATTPQWGATCQSDTRPGPTISRMCQNNPCPFDTGRPPLGWEKRGRTRLRNPGNFLPFRPLPIIGHGFISVRPVRRKYASRSFSASFAAASASSDRFFARRSSRACSCGVVSSVIVFEVSSLGNGIPAGGRLNQIRYNPLPAQSIPEAVARHGPDPARNRAVEPRPDLIGI